MNDIIKKRKENLSDKKWVSYKEAQEWAFKNEIKTVKQWREATKKEDFPDNIPHGVDKVFTEFNQLGGWGGFLKTSRISTKDRKKIYCSYEEAKIWAAENFILTRYDWLKAKLPDNIPRTLQIYPEYSLNGGFEGFSSVPRFTNTSIIERVIRIALDSVFAKNENPHRKQTINCINKTYQIDIFYPELNLVIEYDGGFFHKNKLHIDSEKTNNLKKIGINVIRIREEGLKQIPGQEQWDIELKKNETTTKKIEIIINHILTLSNLEKIKISEEQKILLLNILKNGFYQHFAEQIRSYTNKKTYEEAQKWAQDNNIKSASEWKKINKPDFIPSAPEQYYLDFYKLGGWGDFLGTGVIANNKKKEQFVSYKEAQKWAQDNNIKNSAEWSHACLTIRPSFIPSNPNLAYPNEYTTLNAFLGVPAAANQKREWVSYEEAQKWAIKNNIKNSAEWKKIPKENRPFLIPSEPNKVYSDFYQRGGWKNFLNTNTNLPINVKSNKIKIKNI